MHIKIYHNPACGTSRKTLALLHEKGFEPQIVEYLKTPLDAKEITALLKRMGGKARDLLRAKGELYDTLGLADAKWSEKELIGFMAEHPVLMNRPVVVTSKGARLCRPPEVVLEILP